MSFAIPTSWLQHVKNESKIVNDKLYMTFPLPMYVSKDAPLTIIPSVCLAYSSRFIEIDMDESSKLSEEYYISKLSPK
jgi:hypothetical protein